MVCGCYGNFGGSRLIMDWMVLVLDVMVIFGLELNIEVILSIFYVLIIF